MDLNESRGLDMHINTRTCIKFTRFQFTDALEDEKSGSHLSYPISTPNMGYWALKLGTKMRSKDENSTHGKTTDQTGFHT